MRSGTALLPLFSLGALGAPVGIADTRSPSTISRRFNINQLIATIEGLFPANIVVNDLSASVTDALAGAATTFGIDTTENEGAGCADVTILFARGTTEPGNVGVLTGPAFFDAVQGQLGSKTLAVQGTNNYAADVEEFLQGGSKSGSQQLADDVQSTLSQCPETKVVMSGYSQGGQLVHNAADILGATAMAKISSVVIFGDPDDGQAVTGANGKTKVVCHDGDNICAGGDLILVPHLTYSEDAGDAASFVIQQAGL